MSAMGERLDSPFSPSLIPSLLRGFSDSRPGQDPHIPKALRVARGRHSAPRAFKETVGLEALILQVRDPPRERLAAFPSSKESEQFPLLSRSEFGHKPTHFTSSATTRPPSTVEFYADIYHFYHDRQHTAKNSFDAISKSQDRIQSTTHDDRATMVKKRSSIQAILVPSFLQAPLSSDSTPPPSPTSTIVSRMRALSGSGPSISLPFTSSTTTPTPSVPANDSHTRKRSVTFSSPSPRSSPPPAFLLDDDPFANLTSAPVASFKGDAAAHLVNDAPPPPPPVPAVIPRSPLYPTPRIMATAPSSPIASPSALSPVSPAPAPLPRAFAAGRVQPRPAHQRPAFKSRPSLPSLHTLARMNVVLTKKVRKGKVGAGLPFEPWDLPSDEEWTPPTSASPRQDAASSSSASSSTSSAFATLHGDCATVSDFTLPHVSTPPTIANPQPLLPSQIMALGSIAADVEMTIPVTTTPRPTSSIPPRQPETYQTPPPQPAPISEPAAEVYPHDADPPAFSESDGYTFSEAVDSLEVPGQMEGDGYVAEFLERYHQSSRNASEDGHDTPHETMPSFLEANDVQPTLLHTVPEAPEAQQVQPEAASYGNSSYEEDESLEEIVFAENSYLCPGHPSSNDHDRDDAFFTHSDSMLFSSPPSSFSLSRSLSSTSYSSRASSDSIGHVDNTEDEDGDLAASPRRSRAYRHLLDPSLSSLELDADAEADSLRDSHLGARSAGTRTSWSSSGRPSLTRTRSSSNGSASDVLYSPTADDYAMFPLHPDVHHQLDAALAGAPELVCAVDADGSEPASVRELHDGEVPAEGWQNTFGEAGLIGGGYGFGFDKVPLMVTAEAQDEKEGGVESESLASGTSAKVAQLANTVTNAPETAAHNAPPPPSLSSLDQTLLTEQPTLATAAEYLHTPLLEDEMPRQITVGSRPASAIKATHHFEPTDASHSQAAGSGRAYMSSSTSHRGDASSGQTSASYRAGYFSMGSRRYGGQGRGNSDDEDEDEQRRRRRALERGHAGETVVKGQSLEDSSEEDTYRYASASPATSSRENHLRPRLGRSGSRSPAPAYRSPLLSGSSTRPSANFPLSSSSSRYVSEDDTDEDSEDDDVPLAQAIPGALTAQKTIRRQVREEREQRKREKQLGKDADGRRARQTTIRPAGAGTGSGNAEFGGSSSRDAAAMAVAAVATSSAVQQQRQRTMTLPGKASVPPVLNPHDLARKLQNVQVADLASPPPPYSGYQSVQSPQSLARSPSRAFQSPTNHIQSPTYLHHSKSFSRPSGEYQSASERAYHATSPTTSTATSPALRSRSIRDPGHGSRQSPFTSPVGEATPPLPSLRHMRSFHRPSERSPSGLDSPRGLAMPTEEEHRTSHASAVPRVSQDSPHHRSLSLSRRDAERTVPFEPVPALPANMRTSNDEHRRLVKPHPTSTRTSAEAERPPRTSGQHPPVPPLPTRGVVVTQQRVFVGNLQQFHMVEIGPATTAGDVVALMENQGALKGWAGMGGWMVFEIAQDFGLERPIRSYELLADIQSSWLKDKTVNYFMLKLTPLAAPLARSAIPTSSPTHSGYIEWEAKRGKWSKRWVQLKEHSLWISKRDNGKDETHVCSLSNFDVYLATRPHRAPKPFTFTVKSTDKLSLFENTDDYMHSFSCSEKDGKVWMEKILIARSYVLHQERHILFGAAASSSSPPSTGAALSRAGTKKTAAAHRPVQPLINLPPFHISFAQSTPHADVFEPGSLLSKQS